MLNHALDYLKQGIAVIPCGANKRPRLATWSAYQERLPSENEIRKWWSDMPDANIGIVTGPISGICVIDVDTEDGLRELDKICPHYSPTVKTPNGYHYYFRNRNGLANAVRFLPGCDVRAKGGYVIAPPSVNEKNQAYAFVHDSIGELSELDDLLYSVIKNASISSSSSCHLASDNICQHLTTFDNTVLFQEGTRDNDLFHLINHLVIGRMPLAHIENYSRFFARNCNPPFPENQVEIKIKSALSRAGRRERNITDEIREWVLTTNGNFLTTDVYNGLQMTTREEKKRAVVVLGRLVKDGIIERSGTRNGCFRKIESDAPDIDIFAEGTGTLDIRYPLDINFFFQTMEKNIIVYAGEPDAGKTAMALNTAVLNVNRGWDIRYMSSEMGAMELKSRLLKFEPDVPYDHWKKVNFKEVAIGWQDYILPNGINIIDYLEITTDFFMVGDILRKIFDRLKKGIAVICLQKKRNTELAYGAETTLKLPRLYVSLSSNPPEGNIAKVIKCKNWYREDWNPNGRSCVFKLVGGSKIITCTRWDYDPPSQKKGKI